jgi:hypothetical protein
MLCTEELVKDVLALLNLSYNINSSSSLNIVLISGYIMKTHNFCQNTEVIQFRERTSCRESHQFMFSMHFVIN